jgi:hypothetical protein
MAVTVGEGGAAARAEEGAPKLDRRYAIAIGAALAMVAAFGLWILSRRFGIELPSLIDDWNWAGSPPPSAGDMLAYFFEPTRDRFRPTYEVWEVAQWHAFGAPQDMLVPNLLGVVRMLAFCVAIVVIPGVVVATRNSKPTPLLVGALCAAGGLLILSSPTTDGVIISLGAQEPLLVGTMVTGVALLAWSTGRLLGKAEPSWLTTVGLVTGFALWAFGVYFKEASIVLLAGAPFLYLHLDRRWRERGLIDGPLWRERPFQLVTAASLLPAAHLAVGLTAVPGGVGYYSGEQPDSLGSWLERFVDAAGVAWDISAGPGLIEWRFILPALIVLAAAVAIHRKRMPWLAIGCLVAGAVAILFQGLLLEPQPRFLIPGLALFVMAAILLFGDLPSWLGWAAVLVAVAMTASDLRDVRAAANHYADWQEGEAEALEFVSRLNPESCPTYMMNMGTEIGQAMPKLVGLLPAAAGSCPDGLEGILVGFKNPPLIPYVIDDEAYRACADPRGPELLHRSTGSEGIPQGSIEVFGCRRFSRALDGQSTDLLLARNRLQPGVGILELRSEDCAPRYGAEACSPLHQPG